MFSRIRASKVLCPHSLKLFTLSSSLHGSDTVGIFIDPDMGDRILAFVSAHACLLARKVSRA